MSTADDPARIDQKTMESIKRAASREWKWDVTIAEDHKDDTVIINCDGMPFEIRIESIRNRLMERYSQKFWDNTSREL